MTNKTVRDEITVRESLTIEALMLANHVEAVNGLLYMSAGGWTDHHRIVQPDGNPPVSHFGVALSIRVPWNSTNEPHRLTMRVENEDSTVVIAIAETPFSVGRPPLIESGDVQHVVIGINIDTIFPRAGGYRAFAQIDDDGDFKTWPFRVHDVRQPNVTPTMPHL
jgi:Family of unknown function (DUF6941)